MDKNGNTSKVIRVIAMIIIIVLVILCGICAVCNAEEAVASEPIVKMTIDLTGIITAIIGLIFTFITTKLIPLIKAKTTKEQQETMLAIAKTVVYAAEQLYGAGHGDEKLDYALARLGEMGYKIDSAEVRAVIEAAVKELKLVG